MTGRTTTRARSALALTAAGVLIVVAGPAEAATPQVTKAEYTKVTKGMTRAKVTHVVGAKGKIYQHVDTCTIRSYTGWAGTTVYFKFDVFGTKTTPRLFEKAVYQDFESPMIFCPIPS